MAAAHILLLVISHSKFGHYAPECRKKQFDMNRQNANFSRENHSENSDSMFITCNVAQEISKELMVFR